MDVRTVEIDGVKVDVNVSFFTSWKGVKLAAAMMETANSDANDVQKLGAAIPYFEGAISNFDEVIAALGGDDAPIDAVLLTVNKAISEVRESKN